MGNGEMKKADVIDVDLPHPKFANSKLVKVDNNVHLQTKLGCDQKDYQKWVKRVEQHKAQRQHLLLPIKAQFQSTNLCGASGHAILDFPYYPYLLSEEIYNRQGKKSRFQQTDLWYLLYTLTSAKIQMQKFGSDIVGDIRINNIFLNDEGKVKVGTLFSWPGQLRSFQKALDKQQVYLAPQQFQNICKGQHQNTQNLNAEIFSIGLTILNAGLLINDSSVSLYDFKGNRFNYEELDRRIHEWIFGRGYSEILKSTVLNLINKNSQQRLSPNQLWDYIHPHEQSIDSRKNFVIYNAPEKIHKQVIKFRSIRQSGKSLFNQFIDRSTLLKYDLGTLSSPQKGHALQLNHQALTPGDQRNHQNEQNNYNLNQQKL